MLLMLLFACAPEPAVEDDGSGGSEVPTGDIAIRFEPETLDFGDQDVFTTRSLTLLVHNEGEENIFIVDAYPPGLTGFELGAPSSMMLTPGSSSAVNLTWTPANSGTVSSEMAFDLSLPGGEAWTTTVPVTGSGHGALVVLSPRSFDFDVVKVGCESGLSVSVSNAGDQAVVIDEVYMDGKNSFWMLKGDDDDLPWTLEPYSNRSVNVKFSPSLVGDEAAVLEFRSASETWSVAFKGVGAVDGEETVTYKVGELAKAASLWHVADCASYGYPTSTAFDDSIQTLFDTLNDAGASYRIAFLRTSDGQTQSSYDYVDETFSSSHAAEIAIEMVAGGCTMNNDASFTTLLAGAAAADDWLNDGKLWEESKISLIGINNDNDTSGGNATASVALAQALRDDPELVTFHAIGEANTGACQGSVPFTGMIEAVEMTDGLFLNICDTDWDGHMEKLAAVIMNGSNSIFPLGGTPLASSVQVKVDGVTETEGWEYDEGLNAVVFADYAYPDAGASLSISYLTSDGC